MQMTAMTAVSACCANLAWFAPDSRSGQISAAVVAQ